MQKIRFRRVAIYFGLATLSLVLLTGSFVYFNLYLPMGQGPAGPQIPSAPFVKPWSERPVLLLGIGDSVTAGFGAAKGYSYFDRLLLNPSHDSCDMAGKSLAKVFPHIQAINLAVSGTTSLHHFKNQISKLRPYPSDTMAIVVITTGGNDIIHSYGRGAPKEGAMYGATFEQAKPWIVNYQQRLIAMIEKLQETFPGGCHIFLANIYDPTDGRGSPGFTGMPNWPDGMRILAAYNEAISNCGRKYPFVHLVDMHDVFLGHGINCRKFWLKHYHWSDPHYWFHANLEDPNPRGYDAIRRAFLSEIIRSLNCPIL